MNIEVSPIIKEILEKRRIENISQFIHPTVQKISHPFSFPSIEKGCNLISEIISEKGKIFIYGDGDIDGIISVFFLNKIFSEINIPFSFHLTHRLEDYEIESSIVKNLKDEGYSLIITVDCGISSYDFLKEAEKQGLKVIVIDHHIFDMSSLPSSHIYINPNSISDFNLKNYISSASLVFKVIEGLKILLPGLEGKKLYDTFELVGLTILSDHLPVIGENRIFLHYCLKNLLFTKVKGLKMFLEHLKIKGKLKTKDILMKLNPKLNAPGRFGRPEITLNLLMEENEYEISKIIKEIEYYDRKRYKEIKKVISKIEKIDDIHKGFLIIENILPSLCGSIASRLSSKYEIPFLVGIRKQDIIQGSARSPHRYNLYEKLQIIKKFMISFGGHPSAVGFKFHISQLERIKNFWEKMEKEVEDEKFNYDLHLEIEKITPALVKELSILEPYGPENPAPVFYCEDIEIKKIMKENGEKRYWLKKNNCLFEGYFTKDIEISNNKKINIFYTPHLRENNGLYRIYLEIKNYTS